MRRTITNRIAAALAVCAAALVASNASAAPLIFTIDSSLSYVQLAIPNFSYSGNTVTIAGQNRTNGAQVSAWTTTQGNQSFISGTLSANVEGSFSGKTLSEINFVSGANNLNAIASGNYRPNPAAYNSLISGGDGQGVFNNNSAGSADFGATAIVKALGGLLSINAGLVSFGNVQYDVGSSALAGSNQVGSGTFATGTALQTGIESTVFSVTGLSTIAGQVIPNAVATLGPLVSPNATSGATYTYTSPTTLQIRVPVKIPISINAGSDSSPVWINGTGSGVYVANATVPEPSTLALVGVGLVSLVAMARRRRNRLAKA